MATEGRGVSQAKEVAAVQDGAEWIQGFVDLHRPDALRILDFAHAAGYLREIAELVRAAGTPLPKEWVDEQLHEGVSSRTSSGLAGSQPVAAAASAGP